ncbi:MAG: PKD domain-containing protein [Candidatus Thermoplasmatota archaeon]
MEERVPIGIEGAGEGKGISAGIVIAIVSIIIIACVAIYFLAPARKPEEITVKENIPPVADFTYLPEEPVINNPIKFTDKSKDEDGRIVNWSWNFGDANFSFNQFPEHQYVDAGTYVVSLTVKDNKNATASKQVNIVVSDRYYFKDSDSIQGSSHSPTTNETTREYPFQIYRSVISVSIFLNYTVTKIVRDSQINLCLYYKNITANTTTAIWVNGTEQEKRLSLSTEEIANIGYGRWYVFIHHYNEDTPPTGNTADYIIEIYVDYRSD